MKVVTRNLGLPTVSGSYGDKTSIREAPNLQINKKKQSNATFKQRRSNNGNDNELDTRYWKYFALEVQPHNYTEKSINNVEKEIEMGLL